MIEYKFTVVFTVENGKIAVSKTKETNQPWSATAAARELLKRRNVRSKRNGGNSK